MPRLHIAGRMFQRLLLVDKEVFLKDPYAQAQRALMLADTLLAAHEMTGSQAPGAAGSVDDIARAEIEISVRAAKANFADQHLATSLGQTPRTRRH